MNNSSGEYSTKRISKALVEEITTSLKSVSPYGSVEIYVQDNMVTQITIRNIKKTRNTIGKNSTGKRVVNNL